MTLEIQPETRQKLERVPALLRDEFSDTPPAEVSQTVDAVTRDLLVGARIEDFLPVLVHRYAREQLLDRSAHLVPSGLNWTGPA
ncbi:MAG: hypothetical protein C5B48_09235 [Candidatus Rokuibacteriota bacterium]|nr:MAG: hypothetical protein C5B48_09235 [Candidatus Rokubacteria bacterium]